MVTAPPAPPDLTTPPGLRRLPSRTVVVCLSGVACLLVLAHYVGLVAFGADMPGSINLDGENTPGAWFGSMLHVINAALLMMAAAVAPNDRWRWRLLAALVLAVSIDEIMTLHEKLGHWLRETWQTTGVLAYAWIVPIGVVVAAAAVVCTRTVLRAEFGRLMVLGAAVFVAGSMGVEMIESARFSQIGQVDSFMLAWAGLEEAMEMGGAIIVTAALLRHLPPFGILGGESGHLTQDDGVNG